MGLTLRPYNPETDASAVAHICTATALPSLSRTLLPHIPLLYSTPYTILHPSHIIILSAAGTAVGYIIGTPDSSSFIAALTPISPPSPQPPSDTWFWETLATPSRIAPFDVDSPQRTEFLERWPAHLHVDLLEGYTGGGWGGKMMKRFLERLKGEGVGGVHLGVAPDNAGARRFYERWGFRKLVGKRLGSECVWMVRGLEGEVGEGKEVGGGEVRLRCEGGE